MGLPLCGQTSWPPTHLLQSPCWWWAHREVENLSSRFKWRTGEKLCIKVARRCSFIRLDHSSFLEHTRLQVELITPESAVKFLYNVTVAVQDGEETPTTTSQKGILLAVKAEVRAAAEAKANEGKKPGKGSVAEGPQIDDSVFTSAFCQALSGELLRKCISAQALLHPICRRRGFVLDAWDGGVVTDAATLLDSVNVVCGDDSVGPPFLTVDMIVELHVSFMFYYLRLCNIYHCVVICTVSGRSSGGAAGQFARSSRQGERISSCSEISRSSGRVLQC